MSISQSSFESELTTTLNKIGFDLKKRDVQELLDTIGGQVQLCLKRDGQIQKSLKEEGSNPSVVVRGLGKFTIRSLPARIGRNPQTGQKIKIKASKKMRVLAPKPMRDFLKVK